MFSYLQNKTSKVSSMASLNKLLECQSCLADHANDFLSYFGQDADQTLAAVDKVYKGLTPGLSIEMVKSLPQNRDLSKAIALEVKLTPLISM